MVKIRHFIIIVSLLPAFLGLYAANKPTVLILIPSADFNESTYLTASTNLKKAGIRVYTVSWKMNRCKGSEGLEVRPDLSFETLDLTDYNALLLVGGPGSYSFTENPRTSELLKDAYKKKKYIAAEGLAVLAMANAGILKNRRCTGISTIKKEIGKKGGFYTAEKLVIDGNILTSDKPSSVEKLVKNLIHLIIKGE